MAQDNSNGGPSDRQRRYSDNLPPSVRTRAAEPKSTPSMRKNVHWNSQDSPNEDATTVYSSRDDKALRARHVLQGTGPDAK